MQNAERNTLSATSRHNAESYPSKIASHFEGRETTFSAFDANVDRVANGLKLLTAERVSYFGKNSDLAFEIMVGASRVGAAFAPIHWRLATAEVSEILLMIEPQVLFVETDCIDTLGGFEALALKGIHVITMENSVSDRPTYTAWRDQQCADPAQDLATPDNCALILSTSGTTGRPKGVMLSHANILKPRVIFPEINRSYEDWRDTDIALVAMPLAHVSGVVWWAINFFYGCTSVIAREFNPNQVLEFIQRDRVTKLFLVPAAIQIVLRAPEAKDTDFSCLRHILYGAAPMPLTILREAIDVMSCGFIHCYGMSETTGTVTALEPDDHDPEDANRLKSAGRALLGSEIKIVDPEREVLAVGEIGEIAIRGPSVMLGYWNNPEATSACLDQEGWMHSGDAGYMDEDGYVFIRDRLKDMIITGGENVYSIEVENAIQGHPDIFEVAVIGVPDDRWGEAVIAIVTERSGHSVDAEDVIAWARTRLATFKCPKSVQIIDVMPRNASGKLQKAELRKSYSADRARGAGVLN